MTNSTTKTAVKSAELSKLSVKTQTLATIAAVCGAVALPQMVHVCGKVFGAGSAIGEILLPMQLPVLLVALLAGPYAGLLTGFLAPVISFLLTGMPTAIMLPVITVELVAYGLCAGALRSSKMSVVGKVLLAQVAGRAARAVAVLFAVYALGSADISADAAYMNIRTGVVGILIQLVLLPVIVYMVGKANENESRY